MDEELKLIVGHVYEGKRPAVVGWGAVNDRQIKWIGIGELQYDSPSVADGRRYPKVAYAEFRKWAARDITDQMPKGEWRTSIQQNTSPSGGEKA
jgi:hypothetical protein